MYEEKDVYAVLGIEQPAETAPEADENTDGVVTGGDADGEESREVADPGQRVEESENTDPEIEGDADEESGGKAQQSREERSRHAAARRKAEQEAAIQAALQKQKAEHDAQMQQLFAGMNLTDPDTGKPVTNMEEYAAMQRAQQQRKLQKNLREGKLLPEDLQAMIRAEFEKAGDNRKQPQPAAPDPAFQQKVTEELAEIGKLDSSVKSLEDILAMETAPAFRQAVNRGATFLEAFKLANFDRLQQAGREESARRAQQAALNSRRGKEHLTTSAAKGKAEVAVPADTMQMYRMLMPGKSDDEITAHYNRTIKSIK